jgi:hypothetical protein
MAAHAVIQSGEMPRIFSKKRPSRLFGAQYLHKPIPDVTDRDDHVTVEYMLRGTAEDYRRRVYGKMWDGTVSPEDYADDHEAWDIRETYKRLFEMYQHYIVDVEVDANGLRHLIADRDNALIVNTIPLPSLCYKGHIFRGTPINAAGDAPDLGIDVGSIYHCPPNTVICNGDEAPSWYRISRIFDHTTVEWPSSIKPVIGSFAEVVKPTEHNCDCWPELMNVGRYGSWTKGVLSHTAYDRVMERIADGEAAQAARYHNPDVPTLF